MQEEVEEAVSLDDISLTEMTGEEITKELIRVKDEGNVEFKSKSFLMAGSKFTEGIALYLKHEKVCRADKELMAKVT